MQFSRWASRRLGRRVYLALAALVSLAILADHFALHLVGTMERRVFDLLVAHRLHAAPADADIVIVDIDEASLAAMAPDFGRWPWPNRVFGEFVAAVEKQQPKAIVFDILFSDRDVQHPDSDADFDAAIAASRHTYFPMLRLGAQNDALSKVLPSMLPGVAPLPGAQAEDKPLAVILPQVPAAIANGRLGTHNVEPDKDSVIRRYPFRLEHAGWGIPSLPSRIAAGLGASVPERRDFLINWRGKPFTYRFVPFAEVYRDALRKHPQRPADEFAGKIVLVGSTAPSLFDIKASPLAKIHPGVEMLATAIDNVKSGDWLREQPAWLTPALSLAFVWGMAVALYRRVRIETFDAVFTGLQAGFVIVSYATLNLTAFYLDLSATITFGFAYFSLARIYAKFGRRWQAGALHFAIEEHAGPCRLGVLAVRLDAADRGERRQLKRAVDRLLGEAPPGAGNGGSLFEEPGLLRDAFADLTLLYWLEADGSDHAQRITAGLRRELPNAAATGRLACHGFTETLATPQDWRRHACRAALAALAAAAPGPKDR